MFTVSVSLDENLNLSPIDHHFDDNLNETFNLGGITQIVPATVFNDQTVGKMKESHFSRTFFVNDLTQSRRSSPTGIETDETVEKTQNQASGRIYC